MNRIKLICLYVLIFMLLIPGIHQNVRAQVSAQDSLFLVALYDSTDGPNWSDNNNWLTEQSLSTWYGIGVINGRVATIELGNNNLNGTIPPSIEDLDSLNYLSFYSNQLVDSIPSEIGTLTHLITLDLSLNQLTGPIPPELGNLTNLINLNLRFNKLTGSIPMEMGNLTNLSSLYLSGNSLSGSIPSAIGDLTSLTALNLGTNMLSGSIPPEIGDLTNLVYLDLGINDLSGSIPIAITNLTHLTGLVLRFNKLTGSIPPEISNLTNLINLNLSLNSFSGSIPTEIGDLTGLVYLILNNNQLSGTIPAEIDSLIQLTSLRLEGNQLSGTVPPQMTNLLNLEYLYIYDNQLVDLPALDSLTALNELRIQNNQFTFEDIEPNMDLASEIFSYSPQDSVGIGSDTTLNVGDNLNISVLVGGTANQYQWMKNGTDIAGAAASVYTIESFDSSDAGSYVCRISNNIATELILYSKAIQVAGTSTVGIPDHSIHHPEAFVLYQNYPNPFNPTTTIKYNLTKPNTITLKIFNLSGQEIETLVKGFQSVGEHQINWQPKGLSSGIYFYRLEAGDPSAGSGQRFSETKKLILTK